METKLSIGMRCIQYLLFLLSFIFLCIGLFMVALGVAVLVNYLEIEELLSPNYLKPVEILIAVGVITIFVSFFGCLGSIKRSTATINIYSLLLFLLCLLELAALITALVYRPRIVDDIKENMNIAMYNYNKHNGAKRSWDFVQEMMKCCGIYSPLDWSSHTVSGHWISYEGFKFTVPYSCCGANCKSLYSKGCWIKLSNYIDEVYSLFIYSTVVIIVFKFLAAVLAFKLAKAVRRNKTLSALRTNYEESISADTTPISATNAFVRY